MEYSPNIRHLRTFLAVADCKSISKATELVYLSQPAITQAVLKLEASLETTLFERKSDGMYLTTSGEALERRVRRALQTIRDGLGEALRLSGKEAPEKAAHLLNLVTTTQLRALAAVSTARNFSLAGRGLGICQSSVSRSCKELESLLDIPLLEKTSAGISPSKAAMHLIRATKIGFSEVGQGREEIHALHDRELGHLRIGSLPLARASILPRSLLAFSGAYPDFRVSITDGPYNDLLYHLHHADIDVLIGALRSPSPSNDVIQEELFSLDVEIVARADRPYFSRYDISIDLLAESEWVAPPTGTQTRMIFEDMFIHNGKALPKRIIESGSQILTRSLLEGSNRISLMSAHQVQRELEEGLLRAIPAPIEQPSRPIGLTTRKGWQPTQAQQAFIDLLRTQSRTLRRQPQAPYPTILPAPYWHRPLAQQI